MSGTDGGPQPEPSETLRERVGRFLSEHRTMTLGTSGPDGTPAAAPLFYAHDEGLRLYYLSSPRSQHAANVAENGEVAVAVYGDDGDWREIRGVQMRGHARRVTAGGYARALRLYVAKFDFMEGLLRGDPSGIAELLGPLARCRFYVVEPTWIRLIDNSVSFGYREEWTSPGGDGEGLG